MLLLQLLRAWGFSLLDDQGNHLDQDRLFDGRARARARGAFGRAGAQVDLAKKQRLLKPG